jgi:hypothetical protein
MPAAGGYVYSSCTCQQAPAPLQTMRAEALIDESAASPKPARTRATNLLRIFMTYVSQAGGLGHKNERLRFWFHVYESRIQKGRPKPPCCAPQRSPPTRLSMDDNTGDDDNTRKDDDSSNGDGR